MACSASASRQFQATAKRSDNALVLKLGTFILEKSLPRQQARQDHIRPLLVSFVQDFNVRIATHNEVLEWRKLLILLASEGNNIGTILEGLFTQMRDFVIEAKYPDFGEAKDRKLSVAGHLFNSKAELREQLIHILQSEELQVQFSTSSKEYKLLYAVFSFHPQASEKLLGLKSIHVGHHPRYGDVRVYILTNDKGAEEPISFMKCLSNIQDPALDLPRRYICETVNEFMKIYTYQYSSCLIDALRKAKPNSDFLQVRGRFVNMDRTMAVVDNFVKSVLYLLDLSSVKASYDQQQNEGNVGISFQSLDNLTVHRGILEILFEFLHSMEIEKNDTTSIDCSENEAFLCWREKELMRCATVLSDRSGRVSEVEKQKAQEFADSPALQKRRYDELRTEHHISPVSLKLDDAFSSFAAFIKKEFDAKKSLWMGEETYLRHFSFFSNGEDSRTSFSSSCSSSDISDILKDYNKSRSSSLSSDTDVQKQTATKEDKDSCFIQSKDEMSKFSGLKNERTQQTSLQSQNPGFTTGGLGLFSNASCSSHDRVSLQDETNNSSPVVDRPKICLRSSDSPLLPLISFYVTSQNPDDFYKPFLDVMFDQFHDKRSTVDLKIRALSFITSFCCRARHLKVDLLKDALSRLLSPLQFATLTLSKLNALGSPIQGSLELEFYEEIFASCLEILAARLNILATNEDSLEFTFAILAKVVYSDKVYQGKLLSKTPALVCRILHQKISSVVACLPKIPQLVDFLAHLDTHSKTERAILPSRPFDKTDLRHLRGYVQQETDWVDWQNEVQESTHPSVCETWLAKLETTWSRVYKELEEGERELWTPVVNKNLARSVTSTSCSTSSRHSQPSCQEESSPLVMSRCDSNESQQLECLNAPSPSTSELSQIQEEQNSVSDLSEIRQTRVETLQELPLIERESTESKDCISPTTYSEKPDDEKMITNSLCKDCVVDKSPLLGEKVEPEVDHKDSITSACDIAQTTSTTENNALNTQLCIPAQLQPLPGQYEETAPKSPIRRSLVTCTIVNMMPVVETTDDAMIPREQTNKKSSEGLHRHRRKRSSSGDRKSKKKKHSRRAEKDQRDPRTNSSLASFGFVQSLFGETNSNPVKIPSKILKRHRPQRENKHSVAFFNDPRLLNETLLRFESRLIRDYNEKLHSPI